MSVKLIAKRRLAFRNPEDNTFTTVLPHEFATCPDWVRKDPIFQWGVSDGTITVADTALQVPKPEDKQPKAKDAKGSK